MMDGLGSVSYSYDTDPTNPTTDKLTQESRTLNGVGTFITLYTYNIKGDITKMTYPSGRVVKFNYNTGGGCCNSRLLSVVDQTTGGTIASGMTFNAAGGLLTRTLNPGTNGISESFSYNNRLQLGQITASVASTSVMNFSYNYGIATTNTGRVLSRTDAIQAEHSMIYGYDSIYRLGQAISQDASWDISWGFDVWGNRTAQTPRGLATSKVGTQTSGYSNNRNTTFTYDAAGNQTNDGLHNYTFNAENQITQMDGGAAVYAYDGEGRRMKRTATVQGVTETTYYFYGPGGVLCEFSTVAGTSTATTASANDRATYRTSDKLGSAVLFITSSGSVVENNRTLPYGEAWLSEVKSINDKKFTTYQRDQESGLDYAGARFDNSSYGRFMSPDSGFARIAIPASLNRYSYSINDPINLSDPDGRWHGGGIIDEPSWPFNPCDVWDHSVDCILMLTSLMRSRVLRGPTQAELSQAREARAMRALGELDRYGTITGWDYVDGSNTRFAISMSEEMYQELAALELSFLCATCVEVLERYGPQISEKVIIIGVAALELLRRYMARQPEWDVQCDVNTAVPGEGGQQVGQVGPVRVRAPTARAAVAAAQPQLEAQMKARYGATGFYLRHCWAERVP
jgi:RHS repeat-associated protein